VQSTRRQGREAALQILYLKDVSQGALDNVPEAVWSEKPLDDKIRKFAGHLSQGALAHQNDIDALIIKYAENWEMSRMAAIDRGILRLAAYELLHETDTPINVIINEALEIAKKYSTSESSKFVNGILDKIKLERK
jgi:N utilization substance protein B